MDKTGVAFSKVLKFYVLVIHTLNGLLESNPLLSSHFPQPTFDHFESQSDPPQSVSRLALPSTVSSIPMHPKQI